MRRNQRDNCRTEIDHSMYVRKREKSFIISVSNQRDTIRALAQTYKENATILLSSALDLSQNLLTQETTTLWTATTHAQTQ